MWHLKWTDLMAPGRERERNKICGNQFFWTQTSRLKMWLYSCIWVVCLNRWIAWGVRCSCGSHIHHACAMKPRGLALDRLTAGFWILMNDSVIIFISRLEIRRFEEHPNSLVKSQILLKSIHKDPTFQSCGRFVHIRKLHSQNTTSKPNAVRWHLLQSPWLKKAFCHWSLVLIVTMSSSFYTDLCQVGRNPIRIDLSKQHYVMYAIICYNRYNVFVMSYIYTQHH